MANILNLIIVLFMYLFRQLSLLKCFLVIFSTYFLHFFDCTAIRWFKSDVFSFSLSHLIYFAIQFSKIYYGYMTIQIRTIQIPAIQIRHSKFQQLNFGRFKFRKLKFRQFKFRQLKFGQFKSQQYKFRQLRFIKFKFR